MDLENIGLKVVDWLFDDFKLKSYIIGAGMTAIALGSFYALFGDTTIPDIEVEKGYVQPSEIEIICADKDRKDPLPETYFKVGDIDYALILDKNRQPKIKKYVEFRGRTYAK
jgi:hypothetical protein